MRCPPDMVASPWGMPAPVLRSAREAVLDALAWVLPAECAGCGAPDRVLCDACRARLVSDPVITTLGGVVVVAGAPYAGTVQRVVLALKAGRTPAASALATLLASALARAAPAADVELAPVPSTRAAFRRRGFDPVLLLLARIGARPSRVLRPARAHRIQKGLGRAERQQNLRGVHRARYPLHGRRFLLVDDVVTTGATLADAARAIREAGGEVVGAIALAATPRRGGP